MIYIRTIIILLFLSSCKGVSFSDSSEALSGGYQFFHEGPDYEGILGAVNIYGKNVAYNYNSSFIIVKQVPAKELSKMMLTIDVYREYGIGVKTIESESDRAENERLADSIINADPYYQTLFSRDTNYWIIAHKLDSVYGPCSRNEYINIRKNIGVPDNLNF